MKVKSSKELSVEVLKSIQKGLKESKENKLQYLGSFKKYT